MEDNNQEIKLEQLPKELLLRPYKYIRDYYEKIYPFMGSKVFSVLSLVPVSLLLPKIPRGIKTIKSKINILILSNPGTAKSSIGVEFEKITFDPLPFEAITDARLFYELREKDRVSLIVTDIARIFSDPIMVKQLENILGDEAVISRNTMRNKADDLKKDIDAVAYLSGTPENINNHVIRDGILARVSPLVVFHSQREHEFILDYVNDEMGDSDIENVNFIPQYYKELLKIQLNQNPMIHPVTGYIISKEIKDEMSKFIKPLVNPTFIKFGVHAVRELEEAYRFMVSHAFLNIFNRRMDGGKIVITEEDMKIAQFLIRREIATKHKIISCINALEYLNLKTVNDLRDWVNRQKTTDVGQETKLLMAGMLNRK